MIKYQKNQKIKNEKKQRKKKKKKIKKSQKKNYPLHLLKQKDYLNKNAKN